MYITPTHCHEPLCPNTQNVPNDDFDLALERKLWINLYGTQTKLPYAYEDRGKFFDINIMGDHAIKSTHFHKSKASKKI